MLIPITLSTQSTSNPKLPSGLAQISHDEVVLIELQGSLEVESNHPGDRDGQFVGKLKIDEATNKPTLIIGHHLLEGKIQTLSKPLAVLVRSKKSSAGDSRSTSIHNEVDEDKAMAIDGGDKNDENDPGVARSLEMGTAVGTIGDDDDDFEKSSRSESGLDGSGASWSITAIVKKKITFSKRPMPITNKVTR